MITPTTVYEITCDICGIDLEQTGATAVFDTPRQAIDTSADRGWRKIDPGTMACPDCLKKLTNPN